MRLIVFSLIAAIVCTLVMGAILEAAKPMNNQNRDLYPKIGFTCGSYWRPIPIADFLGGSNLSRIPAARVSWTVAIHLPAESVARASSVARLTIVPQKNRLLSDYR
jgi:hypothetical protein